jgi:Leu/Phe-tRNA-protein transferase
MTKGGGRLLDVQWQTPHLQSLGAVVIGREAYLQRLEEALAGPDVFASAHESDSLW